ncbi:SMC-Scp complex subunit ScpB [Aureibacillus halotolerans]|uniref:Segregation and condensation protein B n=1 Tax=Aureibacillus halotolerans TaxID=1508390 RepID=A0A4R6U7C8_9BACI|nr:SMC-Scp complex subunit ScpB [Aureibacillus halotolerans]TDQ41582.1 segregation and condensation protein B [Aureibacillus halotolerans]
MNAIDNRAAIIEAMLFAAGNEGADLTMLANALECSEDDAAEALTFLQQYYENQARGLHIIEIAGMFQLATKPAYFSYIDRLVTTPGASTLSQAALETLAIIAYNQPMTRPEIEDIRGVKSERPIATLLSRELIEDQGRKESSGRAILYGTTPQFLEHFGLKSIEGLPPLPVVEDKEEPAPDLFFDQLNEDWDDSNS